MHFTTYFLDQDSFFLATQDIWDLSSPTKYSTCAPCLGSVDHQGSPNIKTAETVNGNI